MRQFVITNENNEHVTVQLVRYFKFNNDKFLIYSRNEIDEKNYMKLYLVRIMEELGEPVVQTISNDKDWATMQGIVKKVLKEIKNNKRKLLEDLNYNEIENIKVASPRFFKLEQKLVEVLSSNYMEEFENNELESIEETLARETSPKYDEINNDIIDTPNVVETTVNENIQEIIDTNQENIEEKNVEEDNISLDDSIDYKKLYLAVKEENESSSELISELMQKIMKYQEKYGELED